MIRFAEKKDIPDIMQFIDTHWKKGHILARDRSFFEYQHQQGETVSFVLSLNQEGCIDGVLGYIPYGEGECCDIMDALWKVVHTDNPFLGVSLLKYLREHKKARLIASPGINKKTIPIYRFLKYHVGEMCQWYRLPKKEKAAKIGRIAQWNRPEATAESWEWEEYTAFSQFEASFDFSSYTGETAKPYKEPCYLRHRYFDHPVYHYRVFGLKTPMGRAETAVVVRVQEYEGSCILRVIDCIGKTEYICHAAALIDALLSEIDGEYADIYEAGIADSCMVSGGWSKVENSGNIMPDYFSPYLPENIKIYYFSTDAAAIFFKGDGDQDRPS